MSKVYSFRFSEANPREVQAKSLIEAREKEGHSLRQIIVEALLKSSENEKGIYPLLEQLENLVSGLVRSSGVENINEHDKTALSSSFLVAMKGSVKSGLKSN